MNTNENSETIDSTSASKPDSSIMSVFGTVINKYTAKFLGQDEKKSLSIFSGLNTEELSTITVANKSFSFPKSLHEDGAYSSSMQLDSSPKSSEDTKTYDSFYQFGSALDVGASATAKSLTFKAEVDADFSEINKQYASYYFVMQDLLKTELSGALEVSSYLEGEYKEADIWQTPLFKEIYKYKDNACDFFENVGTHVVAGFQLGAGYRATFANNINFKEQSQELKTAVSGQKKGILSGSFDGSTFIKSLTKEGISVTDFSINSIGDLAGELGSLSIANPALISYNDKFVQIVDLISIFDKEGIARTFEEEFKKYKEQFSVETLAEVVKISFKNGKHRSLIVGETELGPAEQGELKGLEFIKNTDKSYLVTITDGTSNSIIISGDNVNYNNKSSLSGLNTSLAGLSGSVEPLGKVVKVTVAAIDNDCNAITIFKEANCQYNNGQWYTFLVSERLIGDKTLEKLGMNGHLYSIVVPSGYEVRVYEGNGTNGRMWTNIAGSNAVPPGNSDLTPDKSAFVLELHGGSDAGTLSIIKRDEPLVTFFVSYGFYERTGDHDNFALPVKNYKHMDSDYLKGKILSDFFSPSELKSISFNFNNSISSIIIPPGVSVNCRSTDKSLPKEGITFDKKDHIQAISFDVEHQKFNDKTTAITCRR